MAQMSGRQARVIDPILTEAARGYKNAAFIGEVLLPRIDVPNRGMKVLKFGKSAFRQYVDTRRAPGAETKKIQVGYGADPIALLQDALDAVVPIELMQDAAAVPGVDLAGISIQSVQDIIALGKERFTADLVRDAKNYPDDHVIKLTGKQSWSNGDSNPAADIKAAKSIVRRKIGRDPNLIVMSPRAYDVLSLHPNVLDKFKYTGSDSITVDLLAKYFDVEKAVVGKAVALPEEAKDSDPAQDVWGNDLILAYVPSDGNYMKPAFGYTYCLAGYPIVEAADWRADRKSWVYGVTDERRPYITGAEAAVLFQSPAGKEGDGGGSADGGGTKKLYSAAAPGSADIESAVKKYIADHPELIDAQVEKALTQAKGSDDKAGGQTGGGNNANADRPR